MHVGMNTGEAVFSLCEREQDVKVERNDGAVSKEEGPPEAIRIGMSSTCREYNQYYSLAVVPLGIVAGMPPETDHTEQYFQLEK